MEEGETASILSRKELRKQKLMEYLAVKGRLKVPNPRPYLRDNYQVQRPFTSAPKLCVEKENKAPPHPCRNDGTKVQTQPTKDAARRAFGVTKKVNVRNNVPIGQQNDKRPSAAGRPAQPERSQNPARPGVDRSGLNACLKKKPDAGVRPSGRASSHAAGASRQGPSSSAARPGPTNTLGARMSLGPFVKTKTGLIPAVTQPRDTKSRLSHVSATSTTANAHKVRSSASSSVPQRPALAQRKTLPPNPAARAGAKGQDQKRSTSQPVRGKHALPSCKSELSSGLKSKPASKGPAAPVKPGGRGGLLKTNEKSTDASEKQKSARAGEKKGNPAGAGGKSQTYKETQSARGYGSAKPQAAIKPAGASGMSQTAPRPARPVSRAVQARDVKTPKVPVRVVPQTEGKKVTAAQEERLRKLQEWREAKGISYKRPPMPAKPQVTRNAAAPQPFWAAMKEEDDAHSLICAVDRSLADCIKLLGEGCAADRVEEVLSRLPAVCQKFAKYWICRARLKERRGDLDVLPMFEEAVRVVLEPVDELRTVVFEILKKKDEMKAPEAGEETEDRVPTAESGDDPATTPEPVRVLISGEKGDSSVVKYKITATPGGPASQQREAARVNGQELRFFTPVRRSVRIQRASLRYPPSLQDHDLCVASYGDLLSEEDGEDKSEGAEAAAAPMYVYRQNEALGDKVVVRLACDPGV